MSEELGTVKWYNSEKGYGFITSPSGPKDVFVHKKHLEASGLHRDLQEGEQVRFTAKDSPKGRSVVTLSVIQAAK